MNVTLSLEDRLVKEVRKIAVEKDTTLTGMIRAYLEQIVTEHAASGQRRRQLEALEESFKKLQVRVGKRNCKREDLYERS